MIAMCAIQTYNCTVLHAIINSFRTVCPTHYFRPSATTSLEIVCRQGNDGLTLLTFSMIVLPALGACEGVTGSTESDDFSGTTCSACDGQIVGSLFVGEERSHHAPFWTHDQGVTVGIEL